MMIQQGLILEGGGLRGNYTAGVLDAFLDRGIQFAYVIGVSAGAGMGASFVSAQRGRNLEILKKYRKDKRYLSFSSFIRTGNYFGLDFIFHEIPEKLIPFDFDAFNRYPGRFVAVCTDCETGQAAYFEKTREFMTALKASSALPYVSRMVDYQGKKYLDGAITDAIPLKKTIAEGYPENVVVLTRPAGFHRKEEAHPPASMFYHKYPCLIAALKNRISEYNRSLQFVEAEAAAGRILVIQPSQDLKITRTEKSVKKLIAFYELGLQDGIEACAGPWFNRNPS
jgi:predicted patatin/cPLA2 family phospholipase